MFDFRRRYTISKTFKAKKDGIVENPTVFWTLTTSWSQFVLDFCLFALCYFFLSLLSVFLELFDIFLSLNRFFQTPPFDLLLCSGQVNRSHLVRVHQHTCTMFCHYLSVYIVLQLACLLFSRLVTLLNRFIR